MPAQSEWKKSYHYGKLSLFTMRLLNDLQSSRDNNKNIEEIIANRSKEDGFTDKVPLLNQAAFLGHAYICLVWLIEAYARNYQKETREIQKLLAQECEVKEALCAFEKISGPRDMSAPSEKLRLIRNAISHARVSFDEQDRFVFSDRGKHEDQDTRLAATFAAVGKLSDETLFAFTNFTYARKH